MISTNTDLAPVFDLKLARFMAAACAAAYAPAAPRLAGMAWATFLFSDKTDARVLMMESATALILAFCGTRNLRDALQDGKCARTPLARRCDPAENCGAKFAASKIEVHEGFLQDVDSLLPKIVERLGGARLRSEAAKPILITGHSLGGAQACLAAFALGRSNFVVKRVYTFGSPRVGNGAWHRAYNSQVLAHGHQSNPNFSLGDVTFRIGAEGDLVTYLPGALSGYRHVGTEVFLRPTLGVSGQGAAVCQVNPNRWLDFLGDEWRTIQALKKGDWDFVTGFHSITGDYEALLGKCAN